MTGVLIGREAERATLRAWLADPDVSVVVVRGPAGSGKTALVNSVLADAALTGALTGSGKYAEGGAEAFGPVMRAVSSAVGAALEQLYDPKSGLESLSSGLASALSTLTAAGLRVPGLLSPAPLAALSGRADAVARVAVAAGRLFDWLSGFGQPIVLFVDDWMRCPSEVRESLLTLATGRSSLDLTLMLAERHDRPLDGSLQAEVVRLLDLAGLEPTSAARLLGRVLGGEAAGAAAMAWLGDQAPTLPFDIMEVARAFRDRDAIVQDGERWTVRDTLAAEIDRPETTRLLEGRLSGLPEAARQLAVGAALWGDAAPLPALKAAGGWPDAAFLSAVHDLASAGVVQVKDDRIHFVHDRIRATILETLGETLGLDVAAGMADRLASRAEPPGDPLHAAALRLRTKAGLDRADPMVWRDRYAEGAQAARARADLTAASAFAEAAWSLHERVPAGGEALELLAREAVLAAVDRRDRAAVDARLTIAREAGVTPAARARAVRLALAAYKLLDDVDTGWAFAQEALCSLGMPGPWEPTPSALAAAAVRYRLSRALPMRRVPEAVVEPLCQIGEAAGHLVFERRPAKAALLAIRVMAAIGPRREPFFTALDAFIHAALGDRRRAAELGVATVARLDAGAEGDAGSYYRALYFGAAWCRRNAVLRDRSAEVRDRALAEGDLVNAARAVRNHAGLGWRYLPSLPELDGQLEADARQLQLLGDREAERAVAHFSELVRLLRHPEGRALSASRSAGGYGGALVDWLPEMEFAAACGRWETVAHLSDAGRASKPGHDGYPGSVNWRFHESLARLKTGRAARSSDLRWVSDAAELNPADHAHKRLALRAQQLHRHGRGAAAVAAYAAALEAAEASDGRLEAGVIAHCAADAARATGDLRQAERFEARAAAVWRAWGASALLPPPAVATDPDAIRPDSEEALEAARTLAVVADRDSRAKSRLLADVAHELRTPLQGMQGLLDLAAGDGRALDVAALSGVLSSLKTVVDDLGEYAAAASGGRPLLIRPVDLAALARSEAALFAGRERAFDVAVDPALPAWVAADEARVRQVVRNLLSNADKYGAGAVTLTVAQELVDAIVITVDDHGPGIPEADLLRLFEPFERGERREQAGGLGLGLAVSRQVAERLGGTLTASNRADGGASFTFRFPAPAAVAPPEAADPARPLRVLVADDVPLIRRVLREILAADGHAVTEAEDGAQAAAALAADRFDLAVLDLTMPGLDGLEVIRRTRALADGHAPLCLLLTASPRPELEAQARDAGAARLLRKPIAARELRAVIGELFGAAPAPGAEPTLDAFRTEAGAELAAQLDALLDGAATPAAAHRAAGLAAQFGWPEVAAACEALEADLLAGPAGAAALARVRAARAALMER